MVEPMVASEPALAQIVAGWPFKPYRWTNADAARLDALAIHAITESLNQPGVRAWSARSDGSEGTALLLPLAWDSRVLGMPAARLDLIGTGGSAGRRAVYGQLLHAALEQARADGVRHLTARVDAADDAAAQMLERCEFIMVDALITFAGPVDDIGAAAPAAGLQLRAATGADRDVVGELAAASFCDGRFHCDPAIPAEVAVRVYREWAGNCCLGTAADRVLLAVRQDQVVGFAACRTSPVPASYLGMRTGTIVLIATARSARRSGVGAALVRAAGDWCREQRASHLEVGTQLRNTAAARLYERCGLRTVAATLTFRAMVE